MCSRLSLDYHLVTHEHLLKADISVVRGTEISGMIITHTQTLR